MLEKPGDHEDVKLQRVKQIFYDVGLPELASTGPLHVTGILKKMKEVEPLPSIAGASKSTYCSLGLYGLTTLSDPRVPVQITALNGCFRLWWIKKNTGML